MIQSFLTFDSMERTIKCNHSLEVVDQCFTVVLFVFQFHPVCNFGTFVVLDIVRGERVKI